MSLHWIIKGQLAQWSQWSEEVRVDLYSTALRLDHGWLLIDPIPLKDPRELLAHAPVAGIALTNANHERAARHWGAGSGRLVYAHPEAAPEFPFPTRPIESLLEIKALPLAGAAVGEVALWHGETLIFGDAIVHLSRLELLPDKYCSDPVRMRESLREQLPEKGIHRVLFAHGAPLEGAEILGRIRHLLGDATSPRGGSAD